MSSGTGKLKIVGLLFSVSISQKVIGRCTVGKSNLDRAGEVRKRYCEFTSKYFLHLLPTRERPTALGIFPYSGHSDHFNSGLLVECKIPFLWPN